MKLTLTLPELENGFSIQGGAKDRLLDLAVMANRQEPVAIRPVTNHDRKIISAILLRDGNMIQNELHIKFRPIWSRVFTLCSSNKDQLLALIIETEEGQYWVNKDKFHKCTFSTSGNGADPNVVNKSQYVLGELLTQDRRPDIILNLIQFLKEN
jgi:hypothetical protein